MLVLLTRCSHNHKPKLVETSPGLASRLENGKSRRLELPQKRASPSVPGATLMGLAGAVRGQSLGELQSMELKCVRLSGRVVTVCLIHIQIHTSICVCKETLQRGHRSVSAFLKPLLESMHHRGNLQSYRRCSIDM